MRLKKIKLAGFKSFVEPTTIPFPGEMTAIVGPNGCGKSNVIDAVRWVLGESSAKNLRGDAMTDVIFNGSSSRKPVGQCSVELVFDNSAGRIVGEYANYNELSVKRLVTRDAQSNYFLNGTKCRRRDITDLFLGTGLGPRSYAIIEQGMISRLIESKPQELRVFIEEAAGISKYKERRRETENRIKHTQDNLERLNDVRDELGKQIEKLQRQAAAATRYKTLRAHARELKGQLAAIRFLKNSDHINTLQKQQQALQLEMDDLVARMHGDEAGLESYKTKQVATKQLIDDLQQQIFTTSNAITRLEQNALHAKQRKAQVELELSRLNEQQSLLDDSMREAEDALTTSQEALSRIEPEAELKEAELAHAKERFEDAEQALRDFNAQTREQEQVFNRLKQNIQQSHSQIQSTMSMQLRTTQRISELNEELKALDEEDYAAQIAVVEGQLEEIDEIIDAHNEVLSEIQEKTNAYQDEAKELAQTQRLTLGELQTAQSTKSALEALQLDASSNEGENIEWLTKLWQGLTVPVGLEKCVEAVLLHLKQPAVSNSHNITELLANVDQLPNGVKVFSDEVFVTHANANTLAHTLLAYNDKVPAFFGEIALCDNDEALHLLIQNITNDRGSELPLGCNSAISPSGLWASGSWIVKAGESNDGVLQRANKIAALTEQCDVLDARSREIEEEIQRVEETLQQSQSALQQAKIALQNDENKAVQWRNQLSLLAMQQQQQAKRTEKLVEELEKQQHILSEEEAQLTVLSEQLAVQEAQIMEHEVHIEEVNTQRESNERSVTELRALVESLTSQNHELALKKQQLENHQNLYSQQITRNKEQQHDFANNKSRLQQELNQLTAPQEMQDAELQALLETKATQEQQRTEQQAVLDDVEQWIREAEQGHQSLNKDIQSRQTQIDKLNIDIEGYRVRANTILEQLDDTQMSLKSILETLPEQAEEKQWQDELEKTQASLQRLGAVNLAAVEEFETQSERKSHLDTQHNDLTEALETLQSAIRKIDKETRTRFSSTFEQVNEDLKMLFPKVFGGGSAYLALTDDDLLETGVTIMARPPGKKNSTIHLLSGGEKALTALSLVFAIFRLNPAPFCLLDEVDAPLDDANVGRFCNLVSEMSQTVQFIYITHNKIAMEMASHLTGVTMAEPGVSRMVAVDVDEAVAFAEA